MKYSVLYDYVMERLNKGPKYLKVNVDDDSKTPICIEQGCPFWNKCAQHETAGDYRSEGGFTPDLYHKNGEWVCKMVPTTSSGMLVWCDKHNKLSPLWFDIYEPPRCCQYEIHSNKYTE